MSRNALANGEALDVGIQIRTKVLVNDHEEGDELAIDVLGRPVRLGASAPCHDNGADQAGIDDDASVIVRY